MESQMIRLNLKVNRLAVICGMVSRDMASTIPTIRKESTMVRAINIIKIYSNTTTGIPCERENSRSNAMEIIGWRNRVKNKAKAPDNKASKRISVFVMVRILPNRYADKSGAKPGERKLNIMPSAMPNVQNTAMAESSRISFRLLSHSTPNAENTEKIAAERIGEMPV